MSEPLSKPITGLADLRKSYTRGALSKAEVAPDPVRQFEQWLAQAFAAQLPEPNAMTLATVGPGGRPSARVVLIKGVDHRGVVFFTNYLSRKGRDLAQNPYASLLFYWIELERQVRIEGIVEKTSDAESEQYFDSRPPDSKIGAWASEQSEVVESRAALARREAEFREKFGDTPPRPPHWGGYRLVPDRFEFWQGRPSRLHDRIVYQRGDNGDGWRISRLAP